MSVLELQPPSDAKRPKIAKLPKPAAQTLNIYIYIYVLVRTHADPRTKKGEAELSETACRVAEHSFFELLL